MDQATTIHSRDTPLAEHLGTLPTEAHIRMIVIHIKACILPKIIQDHLRGMKTCLTMYHSDVGLITLLHGHD